VTSAHAHGGNPSLLHTCETANGVIRIVGPDAPCDPNEKPIDVSHPTQGLPAPPSGLKSLQDLAGLPCRVNNMPGTVSIVVTQNGDISFRCVPADQSK
jgi:hypothetical protein